MHLAALANTKLLVCLDQAMLTNMVHGVKKNCISGSKSPEQHGHKNFDSKKDECLMEDLKVDLVLKKF